MTRILLIAGAALLLAACGDRAADTASPAPTPASTPATPAAPAASPAPAPADPAAALTIPARFHGIWDIAGNCEPASDARLEIAERAVTFYESHGSVKALRAISPDEVEVDLALSGEGESWTATHRFALSPDGQSLTSRAAGDSGAPLTLRRCA